jgi:hypothetical protein
MTGPLFIQLFLGVNGANGALVKIILLLIPHSASHIFLLMFVS